MSAEHSPTVLAFGRHVSASHVDGEALKFTFERDPKIKKHDEPYHRQGNADFHTTKASVQRAELFNNQGVRAELERFWGVYEKSDEHNGCVTKREYLRAHVLFARVLLPSISADEVRASGEEDWVSDAQGAETISKEQLMGCLFELADMYTTSIDGRAYANFLRKLFERVTVKRETSSKLSGVAALPAKRRAFRKSPALEKEPVKHTTGTVPTAKVHEDTPFRAEDLAGEVCDESAGDGVCETHTWAAERDVLPLDLDGDDELEWETRSEEAPIDGTSERDVATAVADSVSAAEAASEWARDAAASADVAAEAGAAASVVAGEILPRRSAAIR